MHLGFADTPLTEKRFSNPVVPQEITLGSQPIQRRREARKSNRSDLRAALRNDVANAIGLELPRESDSSPRPERCRFLEHSRQANPATACGA